MLKIFKYSYLLSLGVPLYLFKKVNILPTYTWREKGIIFPK